jgi:hypothetical protein
VIRYDTNVAAVHFDDSISDRQSQPRSFADLLGREERLKNLAEILLGDAYPGVFDRKPDMSIVSSDYS